MHPRPLTEINELCYHLFCTVESSQLPPCKDCLDMHVFRANYQAAIWRCCLVCQPVDSDPTSSGWITDDDGNLSLKRMRGSPAPEVVLQLLSCKCVRRCKLPTEIHVRRTCAQCRLAQTRRKMAKTKKKQQTIRTQTTSKLDQLRDCYVGLVIYCLSCLLWFMCNSYL